MTKCHPGYHLAKSLVPGPEVKAAQRLLVKLADGKLVDV
jgi:hypothetical protein